MVGGIGGRRKGGWDVWMASPTWWIWIWVSSGSLWWTGSPGVLQFMGCKELDTTDRLNWTTVSIQHWVSHTAVCVCLGAQSCPILCDPMDSSLPGCSLPGILQARILEWVSMPSSSGSSHPEIKIPTLQVDSLLSEQPGKRKNTGVGSLFLIQGIFPTQESNWDFLHYRQILYQLNYQGSQVTLPDIFSSSCWFLIHMTLDTDPWN